MPIAVYHFDYSRGLSRNRDYMSDLKRCHTSVFHLTGIPNPDDDDHADFSSLNSVLRRLPEDGELVMEVWFMRLAGWQPRFATWIRELADHMKSRGLGYDR